MQQDTEYVTLNVVTTATVSVPKGTVVEGRAVKLPNGEQLKFWVAAELFQDSDGEEVLEDLSHEQLVLRDVHLEHGDGEVGEFD